MSSSGNGNGLPTPLLILVSLSLLLIPLTIVLSIFTPDTLSTVMTVILSTLTMAFHIFCTARHYQGRLTPSTPAGFSARSGLALAYLLLCLWLINLGIATRQYHYQHADSEFQMGSWVGLGLESASMLGIAVYATVARYRMPRAVPVSSGGSGKY